MASTPRRSVAGKGWEQLLPRAAAKPEPFHDPSPEREKESRRRVKHDNAWHAKKQVRSRPLPPVFYLGHHGMYSISRFGASRLTYVNVVGAIPV